MAAASRAVSPVTLILSPEEAQALYDITNRVGGAPAGPRGLIDNIRDALEALGFNKCSENISGGIDFEYTLGVDD